MESFGFISVVPPLVVVVFLLLTRRTLLSLVLGVLTAVVVLSFLPQTATLRNPFEWTGYLLSKKFLSPFNIKILIFLYLLLAFTAVLSASGAMEKLATHVIRSVKDPRWLQSLAYFFGLFMFFDGVGSAAVISGVFSKLFRRFGISPQKLAFIADTTAAPMAALIPLSTWIAFELSMFREVGVHLGLDGSAYGYFLESIPFRFYSLFSLIHIPILIWLGRDWGPMKSFQSSPVEKKEENEFYASSPLRLIYFWPLIPVLFLVFGVGMGFMISGGFFTHFEIKRSILEADSAGVLMVIAGICLVTTLPFVHWVHKLSGYEVGKAVLKIWKGVTRGVIILLFAWALSTSMKSLLTVQYLASISQGILSASFLPAGTFILGCLISFMSGTAWGTIAILFPIAVPLAYQFGGEAVMLMAMGAALEGAIFGNHTSPFSETTIISSLSAGCSVESHIRTQLPYCLLIAAISILIGYIPAVLGVSPWFLLCLGVFILMVFYLTLKRRALVITN